MEKYVLAIDQGTTSTRAIIFNHQQEAVKVCQCEIGITFPKPSWVQQDALEIWASVQQVIKGVFADGEIKPEQIASIGITNQRETSIIWDKTTGQPIYDAIVWQSRQTAELVEQYRQAGLLPLLKEKTGLVLDAYFSATKIRWLLDKTNRADDNDDLLFGTVDSWVLWNLTGGKVHATDHTNASRTMLYNIKEQKWDLELLHLFGIPRHLMPIIMDTSGYFGETDPAVFFGLKCPIMAMAGDQQSALFGESCFEKGEVKNTYGTGGFILLNTGEQLVFSSEGLLSTVAWKIGDKVNYALEGSIFVSGSLIKWLRDELHFVKTSAETEQIAKQIGDNGGVYIVPAFTGMGAPYWKQDAKGAFFGLTRGTKIDHIVRAALESMAYQSRDLLDLMKKEVGLDIAALKVDGGAAANNFLLQFQADILQLRVTKCLNPESTALGAARLAGLAAAYWTMEDFKNEEARVFEPQLSKEDADLLYADWLKAVAACLEY